ncbi:MAG: sulfatase, partial [Armatimonadota bacterium]
MVFEHAYTGSYATVPCRKDVMTGRWTFPWTGWSPLEKEFTIIPQVMRQAGYSTQFVLDTPHLIKDGYNFDRGWDGWNWIRGQENDRWCTDRHFGRTLPAAAEKLRSPDRTVPQYLRNVSRRRGEKDYFCAQTMRFAADWLRHNYDLGPFLLYADTFDPHEPWDPPRKYVELYDKGYEGDEIIYPKYGKCDYMTKRELRHTRALYAAELTMVDHWIGKVLTTMERLGLFDNSLVIFTSDHGFFLGENGLIGKGGNPLYGVLSHVPFIARMPGGKRGARCKEFVQVAGTMHGRSIRPLLMGESLAPRSCAVSSWGPLTGRRAMETRESAITDGEWRLIYRGTKGRAELYDLRDDPAEERDLFAEKRKEAQRLLDLYVDFLGDIKAPAEVVAGRSKLPA